MCIQMKLGLLITPLSPCITNNSALLALIPYHKLTARFCTTSSAPYQYAMYTILNAPIVNQGLGLTMYDQWLVMIG